MRRRAGGQQGRRRLRQAQFGARSEVTIPRSRRCRSAAPCSRRAGGGGEALPQSHRSGRARNRHDGPLRLAARRFGDIDVGVGIGTAGEQPVGQRCGGVVGRRERRRKQATGAEDGCRRRIEAFATGHFRRRIACAPVRRASRRRQRTEAHVGLHGPGGGIAARRRRCRCPASACRKAAGSAGGRPAGGAVRGRTPGPSRRGPSRTRRTAAPPLRARGPAIDRRGRTARRRCWCPGCTISSTVSCPACSSVRTAPPAVPRSRSPSGACPWSTGRGRPRSNRGRRRRKHAFGGVRTAHDTLLEIRLVLGVASQRVEPRLARQANAMHAVLAAMIGASTAATSGST